MSKIIPFLLVFCLFSCAPKNIPFGDIADTQWNGTNIAKGILIDVTVAPGDEHGISLSYYHDKRDYGERSGIVDTTGNLKYVIIGKYETGSGFQWYFSGVDYDNEKHSGHLKYDNQRMFLLLDGNHYPMEQIK